MAASRTKKKSVTFELGNPSDHKKVKRFPQKGDEEFSAGEQPMDNAYIYKNFLEEIGNPNRIKITIEPA